MRSSFRLGAGRTGAGGYKTNRHHDSGNQSHNNKASGTLL
jgi:hypothetical protein